MPSPEAMLDLYLHLACASEAQSKPLQRDKFLVLAAGVAHDAGFARIAEDCRNRIVAKNPNHILRNYGSMREALGSDDVRHYTHQLMRVYPFEKAEYLLHKFRASGYTGDHGYGEIMASPSRAPKPPMSPPKTRKRRDSDPRPTGKDGSPDSNNSARPRPAIQRALSRAEHYKSTDDTPDIIPLPSDVPAAGPGASISRLALWCWVVLSVSVGIAIGGLGVHYLLPPR